MKITNAELSILLVILTGCFSIIGIIVDEKFHKVESELHEIKTLLRDKKEGYYNK